MTRSHDMAREEGATRTACDADSPAERLKALRRSIDNLDAALIHILAERFRCTKNIGRLKAASDMPPGDPDRERRQVARLRRLAEQADLDSDFAEAVLNFIICEVIRHHEALRREH